MGVAMAMAMARAMGRGINIKVDKERGRAAESFPVGFGAEGYGFLSLFPFVTRPE
jgi:hypothetical protein